MSRESVCLNECPLFDSRQINGVCPAVDIVDRASALDFCQQVAKGRGSARVVQGRSPLFRDVVSPASPSVEYNSAGFKSPDSSGRHTKKYGNIDPHSR